MAALKSTDKRFTSYGEQNIGVCVCVFLNTCIAQAIEGWALAENKKKFIEHGKHNLKYNQRIVCTSTGFHRSDSLEHVQYEYECDIHRMTGYCCSMLFCHGL